ncbi:response regulator transcription factor [Nitrosomonas sp.]|uniref:response regulator n=1 Tax=Nitrosomonas sp. TaxID=42353 RepID=UPI0025CE884A|nr:response regulator transcription factor [Nitrosomonas sp.]MCC6917011.1 response regulator transcription factor [Nitrosomonas sp.]
MRILLVEDDSALRDALSQALRLARYGVDPVSDGQAADNALLANSYDLVVLDLGLPYLDGIEVLQRLRNRQDHTPVLVLSARDDISERVQGLKTGADDYLTKPFALPELEARIKALLRRASGGKMQLVHGPLEFDLDGRIVLIDGKPADFSVREMAILEVLMQRSGQVVIKTRLAQRISDWENEIGVNTIEVYIHRLRKRLEPRGVRIRTIHGLGYLLEPYVTT